MLTLSAAGLQIRPSERLNEIEREGQACFSYWELPWLKHAKKADEPCFLHQTDRNVTRKMGRYGFLFVSLQHNQIQKEQET